MAKICNAKNELQKLISPYGYLALVAIGQNLGVQHYSETFRAETREIVNRIKGRLRQVQQND